MSPKLEFPCPVCENTPSAPFFTLPGVPVQCNRLWDDREGAFNSPRGDIELVLCQTCGHIFNRAFQPRLVGYAPDYENPLHHSPRFRRYAEALAKKLVEDYALHGKDVLEVGSGDGYFLALLCSLGGNRGIGFDPSTPPRSGQSWRGRDPVSPTMNLNLRRESFSSVHIGTPADFVICRHVLEHLHAPRDLVELVRQVNVPIYIEVPNGLYTLRDLGVWDIIYEHPSYFTLHSLLHLFRACGFEVERVEEVYKGQFLALAASPGGERALPKPVPRPQDVEIPPLVASFAEAYGRKLNLWKQRLSQARESNQKVVLWGAGSKGVTFLNVLREAGHIDYIVDINPRKQGRYIPGTGQKIIPPDFLHGYKPQVIILMNPLYEQEIQAQAAEMGLSPVFWQA